MIGDGVHVGTVHSAKGLEFAHVMVSGIGWSGNGSPRSGSSLHAPYSGLNHSVREWKRIGGSTTSL